jgi:uncharacterized membrane protein YqjE
MTSDDQTTSGPAKTGEKTGEAFSALAEDVRALVREELRRARAELSGKARRTGKAATLFGGAAVLGALAAGTSAVLLVRVVDKVLPRTTSALVVTILYGAGAGALVAAGAAELRRAMPLMPEETVSELREDVRAATEPENRNGG